MSTAQRLTAEEKIEAGFNVRYRQSLIIVWSLLDPIHPQVRMSSVAFLVIL